MLSLGLVEAVLACGTDQQAPVCEPGQEQSHSRKVEDRVAVRHLDREGAPRLDGQQLPVGDEHDEAERRVEREVADHRTCVKERRGDETAAERRSRVLHMALEADGHLQRVSGSCRSSSGDCEGRGRTEPASDRDIGANPDRETVVTADGKCHTRSEVVLIAGKVRPLTLGAQGEPARRDHLDFQVEGQGEG